MCKLTGEELRALEVLIWMDVAWREGKVDAHQEEKQICSPPHLAWDARSDTLRVRAAAATVDFFSWSAGSSG